MSHKGHAKPAFLSTLSTSADLLHMVAAALIFCVLLIHRREYLNPVKCRLMPISACLACTLCLCPCTHSQSSAMVRRAATLRMCWACTGCRTKPGRPFTCGREAPWQTCCCGPSSGCRPESLPPTPTSSALTPHSVLHLALSFLHFVWGASTSSPRQHCCRHWKLCLIHSYGEHSSPPLPFCNTAAPTCLCSACIGPSRDHQVHSNGEKLDAMLHGSTLGW